MKAAIDIASPKQIVEYLTESAQYRYGCSVVGISAPYATAMADDPALREAFLAADLLVPDGRGFVWGSRMLGVPCGERIAIPDLCESLLEAGNERQWKVFVYGGTEEVNAAACANIARRFTRLSTVAGQHGYNQSTQDEDALIRRLKDEQFNLLIVARPSPEKEKFLTRCCPESGVVGVAAGGYADILAGKTRRAPKIVQAIGMEWLYRVIQEPRRLWKRVGWANARFATAVTWAHLRQPSARPWWGSPAIQICAIVLALLISYSRAWNAPYHFDDPDYIQNNPTIRSFEALKEIKVLGFRKLWWLSNAVSYKLSELYGNHELTKPDVRIFRYWNVACHLIASMALFGLLRRIVRSRTLRGEASEPGTPWEMMPFIAAAIFAAHPLCTEAVTYISGRDNGQGGMFYLLGLYAAAVAFTRMDASVPITNAAERLKWPAWFWPLIWTMLLGGFAVLSKESHLTFPAAVALLYMFFFRGMQRRTVSAAFILGLILSGAILAWGMAGRKDGRLGIAFEAALLISVCSALMGGKLIESGASLPPRSVLRRRVGINWALGVVIVSLALCAIVAFPYAYQRTLGALTGFEGSNFMRSLFSQANAVPAMLGRTVAPFSLSIDHDYPSLTEFSDSRVQIGAAIMLGLVLFGLLGMYKRWVGAFGVLLALIAIAPTNSIIERGDIVSERNFYLAAAGGACVIAWLIASLTSFIASRVSPGDARAQAGQLEGGLWAAALGCCVASLFVSLTMLRNDEWNDAYRLWHSAFEKAPARLRVLYNYGTAALIHKRFDEAEFAFDSIIKIGEKKAEEKLFRPDETVQIKCFHLAYANLANVYVERMNRNRNEDDKKTLQRCDQLFTKGVERTAYDPDLTFSYANFLFQMQRPSDAERVLRKSYELHPWAQQLYHPLGVAYLETHQIEQARDFFTQALSVQEVHTVGATWALPPARISELQAFRGLARLRLRDYAGAREDFLNSLKADDSGLLQMLMTTSKTQNLNLKPFVTDPPDPVATRLSLTRRDVLENVGQSIDGFVATEKRQSGTMLVMLRTMVKYELERRSKIQEKRRAFGFIDDPDDDEIPKHESRSLNPIP